MNIGLKWGIIIINIIALLIAIDWYFKQGGHEPVIIILVQFSSIFLLSFEKQITNKLKRIQGSKVKIKNSTSSFNSISDVANSEVDIKNE